MGHGGDIYRNRIELDHSVNLNPLGTPEAVTRAVRDALDRAAVYPDPEQEAVRHALAETEGVSDDEVIAGSGASELLLAVVRSLRPRRALIPEPAFTGYAHVLEAAGCRIERAFTDAAEGFRLQESTVSPFFRHQAENSDPVDGIRDMIVIGDPANPAGINVDEKVLVAILDLADRQGAAVILDESFFLLSDKAEHVQRDRMRRLIDVYKGLIVIRSVTKLFSIPGIRAGYALSSSENIRRMRAQLPEWNLSAVAEAALISGCRVLAETDFAERSRAVIRRERDYLTGALREAGLTVFGSEAPYLLFQGPEMLYGKLLERRILIRDCSDFPGLGRGWFRTAVRDHASNERLIRNIEEVQHDL